MDTSDNVVDLVLINSLFGVHTVNPSFLVSVKNGNLMIFSNFFAKKIVVKNFN